MEDKREGRESVDYSKRPRLDLLRMPGGQDQTGEANAERLEATERGHLLRRLLGQALRAACHHSAGCSPMSLSY